MANPKCQSSVRQHAEAKKHQAYEQETDVLSPLANVSATRAVLDAHGLSTKYSFGQNFLINDAILKKIVQLADVSENDSVLEVGPGIGTLTVALLKHAACVTSIEIDTDLPAVLAETCAPWANKFALIPKDALQVTAADIEAAAVHGVPNKLVANLPYAVAATVVLDFFQNFPHMESATVMVQKEVADRMAAQPGSKNYGAYTVKLRLFTQVEGRFPVGPGNFFPPPRVDSAVIRLDRRQLVDHEGNPVSQKLLQAACIMADAAFTNRRKTITNSFKSYFAGRGQRGAVVMDNLLDMLNAADIDAKRRGETLEIDEFLCLAKAYMNLLAE